MRGEIKNNFSLYQSRLMLQILITMVQQKRNPKSFGGGGGTVGEEAHELVMGYVMRNLARST